MNPAHLLPALRLAVPRLLLLALVSGLCAHAAAQTEKVSERQVVNTEGFLSAHPDLRWQREGLEHHARGDHPAALRDFKRAARFADKASQAMLGEMYLRGEGTPADPVEAYIWMDLAAERGYTVFLLKREAWWARLTAAEQAGVLERGPARYAEYGDEAALPRLEKKLRQGRQQATGSRLGFKGALTIRIPTANGWTDISGEAYYREKFWQMDRYLEWQQQIWEPLPEGKVEIGPLQSGAAGEGTPAFPDD